MKYKHFKIIDKAYIVKKENLKKLYIAGSNYEMGFQHGALLSNEIEEVASKMITKLSLILGQGDMEKGLAIFKFAAKIMEKYIPSAYKLEIKGILDGMASKQVTLLNYDDLIMYNCHADIALFYSSEGQHPDRPSTGFPIPQTLACSSFSAWGKATEDHKLIFNANTDWYSSELLFKHAVVMHGNPDYGYSFICPTYPGLIGMTSGMNEVGIAFNSQTSRSTNLTLAGTGFVFNTRLILEKAASIGDAATILGGYKSLGLNWSIVDAKKNTAAVIEVSASEISIRINEKDKNMQDKDMLWTTNHFNCYPGWQSYSGHNMVPGQMKLYGVASPRSIQAWQDNLEQVNPDSYHRYNRFKQLLNKNYKKITVSNAREFSLDRYDLATNKQLSLNKPSTSTIYWWGAKTTLFEDILCYKTKNPWSITDREVSLHKFVAVPEIGLIWFAMGTEPVIYEPAPFFLEQKWHALFKKKYKN